MNCRRKTQLLCLLFVLTVCVYCNCGVVVKAEKQPPSWVRVVNDDTVLYADSLLTRKMFVLEKSYYLPVVDELPDLYVVTVMNNTSSFPRIVGYVQKGKVEETVETPTLPYYPTVTVSVGESNATLKLSPTLDSKTVLVTTATQKMSYYGTLENNGTTWYYVYSYGYFGYVDANEVTTAVVKLHPTPLTDEPASPVVAKPTEEDVRGTTLTPVSQGAEIGLIIFVCVLAVALTLALFVKEKKN